MVGWVVSLLGASKRKRSQKQLANIAETAECLIQLQQSRFVDALHWGQ